MHARDFPDDVIAALNQGRKIEAIKLLREQRAMGLKDAKEAVEAYLGETPPLAAPQSRVDAGLGRLVVAILVICGLYAAWRFLA